MFGKGYLLYFFAITIGLAYSYDESERRSIPDAAGFPISLELGNNQVSAYRIRIFTYEYYTGDLRTVPLDQTKIKIFIPNARIIFGRGGGQDKQFDLPDGGRFKVSTVVTAERVPETDENKDKLDGIQNCEFTFNNSESDDETGDEVPDVVKQGIYKELPDVIGDKLCNMLRLKHGRN